MLQLKLMDREAKAAAPKAISRFLDFWELLLLLVTQKWTIIQLTKLPIHSINQGDMRVVSPTS